MYTTRTRHSARESFSGVGMSGTSNAFNAYSSPTFLEGVYSWRTGARNIADPPDSPPIRQRRQDQWGLITPSGTGSLVKQLAERKRYMEDFARMMIPAQTDAGTDSTSRTSTTDTGHPFGSLKVLRRCIRAEVDYYNTGTSWYLGSMHLGFPGNPPNFTPYNFGFAAAATGSPLVVSSANRQATANRYFAMTAPDRKIGSIGTTLIELLRGDVPSLLKNFQNMMAGYKTVRNYAGSEALNIMFGWTPLIQEWANIIKVGMALERVVYYESFRRKRRWDGPTFDSSSSSTSTQVSYLRTPWGSASVAIPLPGETMGPASGLAFNVPTQSSVVANENYHFTSKYTGLAKAGRRAESFSDQAMDVVKRMGLVDDPELIWDLTPYSWLLDWFTTMGESIHNAHVYAPFSGKYTVDYAYLTTQQSVIQRTDLLRGPGVVPKLRSFSVTSARAEQVSVAKWRDRATPFGFGTQLGSLSASQFAILVSLGLAKSR